MALAPLKTNGVKAFNFNKVGEAETPNLRKEETKNEQTIKEQTTPVGTKTNKSKSRRELFKGSTSNGNGSKEPITTTSLDDIQSLLLVRHKSFSAVGSKYHDKSKR